MVKKISGGAKVLEIKLTILPAGNQCAANTAKIANARTLSSSFIYFMNLKLLAPAPFYLIINFNLD